ncbi:hypothetical protein [Mesorhizobium sp. L-8-3]
MKPAVRATRDAKSRFVFSQRWAWRLKRLSLQTGVLGFSTFSLDTIGLRERGQGLMAAIYAAASLALSLLGLVAGLMLVRSLTQGHAA